MSRLKSTIMGMIMRWIRDIQWNPDFSNLQGKRKLVRKIGSSKNRRWYWLKSNPRETSLVRIIGSFEKSSIQRKIRIPLYMRTFSPNIKRVEPKCSVFTKKCFEMFQMGFYKDVRWREMFAYEIGRLRENQLYFELSFVLLITDDFRNVTLTSLSHWLFLHQHFKKNHTLIQTSTFHDDQSYKSSHF